jgi:hypothetical protein
MDFTLILSWIWVNIFKLGIIGILFFNIKRFLQIFIVQPIQGKDNHTSMNELAKYIILLCLIGVLYVNGNRETQWAPYSDATIASLVAGVSAIAAISPISQAISGFKKKEEEEK